MAITPYDSAAQQQAINQMYDAQKQTQLSQLENAYNQQRSSYEQAAAQIAPTYQAQANDLAVQYERNKRNLNEQAAARGLNTGTASQQQLALNQVWQRNYGALKGQQAQAETAAQQKMTDLEAAYQQQVAQAIANNDYDRAKALYDEAQTAYQRQMQEDQIAYQRQQDAQAQQLKEAQLLASYGDFSLFANLYGQDAAAQMSALWTAQNPDLAYNTGRISAAQYYQMTGQYPQGYTASSSSGGGGGYRSGGGSPATTTTTNPTTEPTTETDPLSDLAERFQYGSDEEYFAAKTNEIASDARQQAQAYAVANGINPWDSGYAGFVDEAQRRILADNSDYSYYRGEYEKEKDARKDKEAIASQKKQAKAKEEKRQSDIDEAIKMMSYAANYGV